jgi:hypothetical protein
MSGILIVNLWSLVLLASLVGHGWLAQRRSIGPLEFAVLLLGILLAELVFVSFVLSKAARDRHFANRVGSAQPKIAIWYAGISAATLAVLTILFVAMN